MTEEVTFNLLNQHGGSIRTVAIVDQIAYVGVGAQMVMLDITDPSRPQPLGRIPPLPTLITAILIHDNRAFVTADQYLFIFDVTDPEAVRPLAQLELPARATRLAVTEQTLVVALNQAGSGLIVTVDISDNSSPSLLDHVAVPQSISGLAVSTTTVYVGNSGSTIIYSIDSSDPSHLGEPFAMPNIMIEPGSLPLGEELAIFGQKLLTGGNYFVALWDIADPQAPVLLWQSDIINGAVVAFAVHEGMVYLQTGGPPSAPVMRLNIPALNGETTAGTSVSGRVAVQGDLLAVAQTTLTLYQLTANQDTVIEVGNYAELNLNQGITDLTIVGTTGIITDQGSWPWGDDSGLLLIELPSLHLIGDYVGEGEPREEGDANHGLTTSFNQVVVANELAYVAAGQNGWRLFDISDLENPALLSTYMPPSVGNMLEVADMMVVGERLYTAVRTSSLYQPSLIVLDIATPDSPTMVTTSAIPQYPNQAAYPRQIEANDNNIYLVTEHDTGEAMFTLDRFSLNGPEPLLTARLELHSRINAMALYENVILLGTDQGLMVVTNGANDEPLTIIAQAEITDGLWELAIMDGILFATTKGDQLLAIDLQDPAQPRQIGATSLPSGNAQIAAANGMVVVGNASMGVVLFAVE